MSFASQAMLQRRSLRKSTCTNLYSKVMPLKSTSSPSNTSHTIEGFVPALSLHYPSGFPEGLENYGTVKLQCCVFVQPI